MQKRWRKLGGSLIIAMIMTLIMCGFSLEIYAESGAEVMEIEVPAYHYLTETETEVSDFAQVLQRGAHLSGGTVKLVDKGSGKISIYGSTNGYQRCDTVYLNIYLERSTNGRDFNSYLSWEYSASNVSSLSKSFTKSVPKGYYYRLRGYHAMKEGGVKESTSTITGGMYID